MTFPSSSYTLTRLAGCLVSEPAPARDTGCQVRTLAEVAVLRLAFCNNLDIGLWNKRVSALLRRLQIGLGIAPELANALGKSPLGVKIRDGGSLCHPVHNRVSGAKKKPFVIHMRSSAGWRFLPGGTIPHQMRILAMRAKIHALPLDVIIVGFMVGCLAVGHADVCVRLRHGAQMLVQVQAWVALRACVSLCLELRRFCLHLAVRAAENGFFARLT